MHVFGSTAGHLLLWQTSGNEYKDFWPERFWYGPKIMLKLTLTVLCLTHGAPFMLGHHATIYRFNLAIKSNNYQK